MKIKRMTATFGKLEGAVLTPGEGLTLIQAPNEGGKSTWNAFLRAMLYGFPARDRDRNGYLAEKNRYQPWSGAAMEGVLEVEWQGRGVTIVRGPRNGQPWGEFRAVYTLTQEPVPGMTGENCGELLLGISREVFERTVFLFQDSGALTPSAELEKRVAALAATGDELISFSQVERRLKDWMNRRRSNSRTGLIPQLEEELDQVLRRRMDLEALRRQVQEADRRREERELTCEALERQLRSLAAGRRARAQAERDAAWDRYESLRLALAQTPDGQTLREAQGQVSLLNNMMAEQLTLERELVGLRELAAKQKQAAQADPYFRGLDSRTAGEQAERDAREAKRYSRSRWGWLAPLAGVLLGGTGCALLSVGLSGLDLPELPNMLQLTSLGALLGLLVGLAIQSIYRAGRRRRLRDLLDHYDVEGPEGIFDRMDAYERLAAAAQEQEGRVKAAEDRRAQLIRLRAETADRLLALVRPFAPEVTEPVGVAAALARTMKLGEELQLARTRLEGAQQLLNALPVVEAPADLETDPAREPQLRLELEAAQNARTQAREESARLTGQLNAQGDPVELDAREEELTEELDSRRRELAALETAMDSLRRADGVLRERFSPLLNRRAGEYLSILTGGRYQAAALTRQFQALAVEAGQSVHRPDLCLSGGTAQQLYLALRLALCDLVLPEHEPCPIFLDDALDAFDDKRASLALDCLLEMSKRRQVLLFTCHSREGQLLSGRPVTLLRST